MQTPCAQDSGPAAAGLRPLEHRIPKMRRSERPRAKDYKTGLESHTLPCPPFHTECPVFPESTLFMWGGPRMHTRARPYPRKRAVRLLRPSPHLPPFSLQAPLPLFLPLPPHLRHGTTSATPKRLIRYHSRREHHSLSTQKRVCRKRPAAASRAEMHKIRTGPEEEASSRTQESV